MSISAGGCKIRQLNMSSFFFFIINLLDFIMQGCSIHSGGKMWRVTWHEGYHNGRNRGIMSIFRGFSKLTDSHDEIFVELESHERLGETPGGGRRAQSASVSRETRLFWMEPAASVWVTGRAEWADIRGEGGFILKEAAGSPRQTPGSVGRADLR